ncbi:hypothetical protein A3D81_01535 [Candidatus Curtissbacteria bacterium RIFCSPHIGHO2_02_FULL_40_17]|uniref:Aminoglycoside phosphotransferase domain-containing protein n=1 Tax=Candidatus Curtissbacteria bacterium RIFCSPHIGHO2_02_FULL_40_17 TaxID=1797715 RepID=A0A1F5GIV1_9BACT|nr:MAG: hypothetical protein A3D81_01535 [Candidatus Curtissbacteria bacterium RIFCSPHIGHO2_02_FULL_40_17]
MPNLNTDIENLLSRTNLTSPFGEFLKKLEEEVPRLGKIRNLQPILEGYEDANFILESDLGRLVIKIFTKERSPKNNKDYVRILEESAKIGVPVPKLIFYGKISSASFIITEFFEGENFENGTPMLSDIIAITAYLSKLNTLNFPVDELYDSWGNKNLLKEYEKSRNNLTSQQDKLIAPIVEGFKKVDFSKFQKAVIHGDLQRKHVLKSGKGKYCILDFGCMSNDSKVIELSTFLAWFCLQEDTWEQREEIIDKVINNYASIHQLSSQETASIPTLIKASYAAYFLRTSILIKEGDTSEETKEWHEKSNKLLISM